MPTTIATPAISQATRRTCRSKGLSSRPTRAVREAIRPISVCRPVACTSARAAPATHTVPLNTSTGDSSGRGASSTASAIRVTGADSPVSIEESTSRVPSMSRASAGTRSPSAIISTSPGTTSTAGTAWATPSRRTEARAGRYLPSASTARSACCSWTKASAPLSRITPTIAMLRLTVPATHASPAATHSSSASGWISCRSSASGHCLRPGGGKALGPLTSNRRAASREVRPSRAERRSRSSRATGSRASMPGSSMPDGFTRRCVVIVRFTFGSSWAGRPGGRPAGRPASELRRAAERARWEEA